MVATRIHTLLTNSQEDLCYTLGLIYTVVRLSCALSMTWAPSLLAPISNVNAEAVLNYFRQWPEQHGAVVECTSNWYWLCDLFAAGRHGRPRARKVPEGHLLRKGENRRRRCPHAGPAPAHGLYPEAHQFPPDYRALRDLLRQRMVMEHKRTTLMQQITSILAKFNITELPCTASEPPLPSSDTVAARGIPLTLLLYHQQCLQVSEHEKQLEKYFKSKLRPTPTLRLLVSIPGIGDITGAIIAMETGDIGRFADDKHYASYCRLAPGARDSGGKRHLAPAPRTATSISSTPSPKRPSRRCSSTRRSGNLPNGWSKRSNPAIARTVVAKELSKIVYYVLSRQEHCRTFKGIDVAKKRRDWPRTCKPVRLTGVASLLPPS